jgi:PAS domain S-box-containing protein
MVYCSGRDITEEKAQEAERDRLWTLSTDMLARADYQGGMSAVNPAWTRVLGWSQHELLTNPYADIIDPENVPATVAALEEMGRTGRPTRFQNRILAKDGTWKPIDWTVAPEPDGRNFIAVGRDLTSDKARESELAEAQSALRQAQKMEAVGQLTGGIAHDFNNLLAGISGSLEMLEKRLGEGRLSGVDRYIEVAQSSARRAASLTQRLLAFSRRQTLDPKPTDINRLVAGMEDLIRRSVGPEIEVEVVGAGGLWLTRVDPSQLENALLNLTINGRDAMPDGGRLTIETANKWLDQRAAGDRDLPPGQYVSLCVTDTGTGMTPDVIDRAFDPFFTTKPLGQGTGLGLSMIHGFARQSGGQVRIYSEVGKGTTMCLYFPRFVGQLEAVEAPDAHAGAEEGHGETVLVIDDEDAIRMLVTDVLEEAGYRVLSASDGGGGLKILQSDARIDLLITDVGLPGGVNGRQVADAARTTRPELKVLFITGYAENAVVGNGHLDAGMQVITKPFAMSVLGARVREIIES